MLYPKIVVIALLLAGCDASYESQHAPGHSLQRKSAVRVRPSLAFTTTSFPSTDSVQFIYTLTNTTDRVQQTIVAPPQRIYPWAVSTKLYDAAGVQVAAKEKVLYSSEIFTAEEWNNFKISLRPGQSVSHPYKLINVLQFDGNNGQLPKGSFILQIIYDSILSNNAAFTIY